MAQNGYVMGHEEGCELDAVLQYDYFTSLRYAHYVQKRLNLYSDERSLSLLDAGCQLASLGRLLEGTNYLYSGLDIDADVIRKVRKALPDAVFYLGDIGESFAGYTGAYDFVVCSLVLGLLNEPERACRNLLEATKAGGELLIIDMLNDSQLNDIPQYSLESYVEDQVDASLGWAEVEELARRFTECRRDCKVSLRRLFDDGVRISDDRQSGVEESYGVWVFEIHVV